ncbi:MAG: sulfatase-like hydrolase/transferase [Spirochaetales bacterium]|nr:sulfatase-like hydrolase/transferase [Spirochaetales bacterium]
MGGCKKNIFVMICDGMRQDTLGCMGLTPVKTPNWDRIAREGVVLANHRTTGPMCSPARASIFTGLQPHRAGMPGISLTYAKEEESPRSHRWPAINKAPFSVALREAGYQTVYTGKWHLGDHNIRQYFDYTAACDAAERDYSEWCRAHDLPDGFIFHDLERSKPYRSSHYPGMSLYRPGILDIPEDKEHNWWVLSHALELLALQDPSRPVFAALSFEGPHPPLVVPRKYYDMYDPADVRKPDNWDANIREPRFLEQAYYRRIRSEWSDDFEDWRKAIAVYWGYITYIDSLFGRFLDRLAELKLLDDAIVVMLADHGDMFGQHKLSQIFCPYDEVLRVPCVIRGSGIAPGTYCNFDTSHVDIAPTVMAAAGIDQSGFDGENISPYLQGKIDPPAYRDCYCQYNVSDFFKQWQGVRNWRSLVRRPWKYVLHENGEAELFNLERDPDERDNVAGLHQTEMLQRELQEALLIWSRESDDPFAQRVTLN